MSAEFDVIKALALAGDVTAAQSLSVAARKELKQSACPHGRRQRPSSDVGY